MLIMDEALREFLREAGVDQYEKLFLEKLELTRLAHLDNLEPADLDELGMGKMPRRSFEKALLEWKQMEPEVKRRRRAEAATPPSLAAAASSGSSSANPEEALTSARRSGGRTFDPAVAEREVQKAWPLRADIGRLGEGRRSLASSR